MGKNKLRGKDLDAINYRDNKARSIALDLVSKHYKYQSKAEKLQILKEVIEKPQDYVNHQTLGLLASVLAPKLNRLLPKQQEELEEVKPFFTFGKKHIQSNTIHQMELAMSLPIAVKGALMPDAHQGYGLPIGGVLASENTIIPYGVGMDIGCRMSLSIYDVKPEYLTRYEYQFKKALKDYTCFGTGGSLSITQENEVLERDTFNDTPLLKKLRGKAVKQLGTSGSGNHFVEFGIVHLEALNDFGVDGGKYLGLLSHSGSRGFGASIAKFYTKMAMDSCLLPKPAQHLAWLDLQSEGGQEYWLSMNLAGDYAKACHDEIHKNLNKALGLKSIATVENHHNFAWKERHFDKDYIIHRKGATPAAQGELGIIPGSMTTSGFIVKGKGNEDALKSAAHGAGRRLSRSKARSQFTMSSLKQHLKSSKVQLIGGGVDEAPNAYKDIHQVMNSQKDLVEIVGRFDPKLVRMDKN